MSQSQWSRSMTRRMRRNQGSLGEGCGAIFPFIFCVVVGLCSLGTALLMLLVVLFGQNAPGTVIGHHTEDAEAGSRYYLDYRYLVSGATYEAEEEVTPDQYSHWSDASTLSVRVLPQFAAYGAQTQLPGHHPGFMMFFWLVFGLLWLAPLLVFVSPCREWLERISHETKDNSDDLDS